ncbi:hypothetical protein SAMN06265348_108144 [Pedobacter westerhofensis]|uniref:ABC-2 type transport system permease protein n=1 Tax=Pedobacter westerhofensis TaxID=425512 RepID=A0A521EHM8_9SPHI|nr:DUF5687 family protein [Pedobacter westerhofensis]SMO83434.1 hypothetical protein SAMN06265348_108144 [Pedobacter westerhofensis]
MFSTFLHHQWIGFWRSRNKGGTIAAQVILGFFAIYLIGVCFLVGFVMEDLIDKFLPGRDVFTVFNGIILYYFAIDFIVRLQIQELPTLAITPYLHLNISKRKLLNFLQIRSLLSVINIFPLIIFFPFCIRNIGLEYGIFACVIYLSSIFSLVIFNNYAALYFKRVSAENIKIVIPAILALAIVGGLEYLHIFSIAAFSDELFSFIATHPAAGCVFPALAISIFLINDRYLKNNLYLENLRSAEEKKSSTDYPFLDRFGAAGTLAALEIKLILRNRRPKATVTKALLLLFYGFIFYKGDLIASSQFGKMLFPAVFMTGNTILIYGQFMFGWQAAEFDGILANSVNIKDFFRAKLILLTISASLLTVLTTFYAYLSWKILILHLAAYLYNIGVSSIVVLYFATRNYKYIDISKGAQFNWEGVSASTMLLALPILLSPYLIYFPLSLIGPYWGLLGITFLGIAGLITRKFWISFLANEFQKRKHQIAAGFRERS